MTGKQKNIFFVVAGIFVLVIAGLIIGLSIKTTVDNKVTPTSFISDITTVEDYKPGSVVIAPATKQWWQNLVIFTPVQNLSALDFDAIDEGAKYIAFTTSKGKQFTNYSAIGTPTTFVIYETEEQAKKALEYVQPYYPSISDKNVLLFAPHGAYADVDYALTQFEKTKTKNSTNPMEDIDFNGEAVWTFYFKDYFNILMADASDVNKKFMLDTLAKLGFSEETVWTGTSKDGLKWEGQFTSFNSGNVKTPIEVMSGFYEYLDKDGNVIDTEKVVKEKIDSNDVADGFVDIGGTLREQSSITGCCMAVSTSEEAAGGILGIDNVFVEAAKIKKDSGLYKLVILASPWQAAMRGDINSTYPFAGYNQVDILVKNKDGKATVVLTPYPKSMFEEIAKAEEEAIKASQENQ